MDDDDIFDDEEEDSLDNTFLTFKVAGEDYAVGVCHVTEIVRVQKAYLVPDAPPCIQGVINLRGKVVPLLDVRNRFGLPTVEYNDRTLIVVVELHDALTGLVVDSVCDVVEIPDEDIESTSDKRAPGGNRVVHRLGKRADGVSFIVDVYRLLDLSEWEERRPALSSSLS